MAVNIINFDYWFDSVDQCIKHLLEEMTILLFGNNIRPCTFDLPPIKLQKSRMNLLPQRLFFHLFCCRRTVGKCQMCTRFFDFDDRFIHEISSYLSGVYIHILKKTEKEFNLPKGNFNFFKG